jgi:two-component system sensor histidine kinase MprB
VDVPVDGGDETGQLGRAFSGMLAALQASKREQHQLVQDAGHELRTPLTSLRTNVSVLRRRFDEQLPAESREQLLADLDSETRELTDLVNELVELATDRRDDEAVQPVRLADVAERAAARARRRFGREVIRCRRRDVVDGRPNGLERATAEPGRQRLQVRPDGPSRCRRRPVWCACATTGPACWPTTSPTCSTASTDRWQMRSKPGSGLGLSIVKSVVEQHGGTVFARNAPGGGAEIGFTLPARLNAARRRLDTCCNVVIDASQFMGARSEGTSS